MKKINKKILLATWNVSNPNFYQNRDWIPILKSIFKQVLIFSPRDYYFRYGKNEMNKKFLEFVAKEKPDYILFSLSYDEFYIDTLLNIKKISPKTKTMHFFGDDNWRYDDWSRYYALFFDYKLTSEKDIFDYKKDKLKNIFFFHGVNIDFFKPLNLEKKYDVSFIGMPIRDRYDYIKFLKNQGIKIKLFGPGWNNYEDLKDIYGGFLNSNDLIQVINQTKINLSFSKTILKEKGKKDKQLKGRILEIPACKAFLLIENFPGLKLFFKTKEINKITFENKKELLKKIKYYLRNDYERERIAEKIYHEVISKYNWYTLFENFFKKLEKQKISKKTKETEIIVTNKKIIALSKKDFKSIKELKSKIKDADYIYFLKDGCENLKYRESLQAYSLEKSKKQISCCDYYVYNKDLGDYLLFMSKKAFKNLSKKDFNKLVKIEQLMVTKKYFLKNIKKFQQAYYNKEIDFINENISVFVSIPLIRTTNLPKIKYEVMEKAFRMKFLDTLYSIFFQKRIFYSKYLFKLFLFSLLPKNKFISKHIIKSLFNKENLEKLKEIKINL